jgi:hypothetical protein
MPALSSVLRKVNRPGENREVLATAHEPVPAAEWEPEPERQITRTPKSTVEALMYALRRGLSCLSDPGNRDRLRRCDSAAIKEVAARLLSWNDRTAGRQPNWPPDDIDRLLAAWRAIRGIR